MLTVHRIHLLRAHLASELLAPLQSVGLRRGIDLAVEMDPDKVTDQYPYDDEEAARLKFLLNFELSWAEREQLVEDSFRATFPDRKRKSAATSTWMSSQIQELSRWVGIGNHSHQHFPLGLLPSVTIAEQLTLGQRAAEDMDRVATPFALSYPYGSQAACSLEAGALASEQGLEFALHHGTGRQYRLLSPTALGAVR